MSNKFKTGDRVRIISDNNSHNIPIGKKVTLGSIYEQSYADYQLFHVGGQVLVRSTDIVKVEKKVKKAFKPKKGDIVVGSNNTAEFIYKYDGHTGSGCLASFWVKKLTTNSYKYYGYPKGQGVITDSRKASRKELQIYIKTMREYYEKEIKRLEQNNM